MNNKQRQTLLLLIGMLLLPTATAFAGNPIGVLKKIGSFIDSAAVKGVDQRYIYAPEKPWQVIVKGNINQSNLKMFTEGTFSFFKLSMEPKLKTEPSKYVGLWAGYRGYGLGYTLNVAGDKGSYLTFGATGGAYGVNVRIHNFKNDSPNIRMDAQLTEDEGVHMEESTPLVDPIKVRTLIADGYYLFNGKRFSYAAAYDQSVIQRRSAGSVMAGAMYYHASIDYATDHNAEILTLMGGMGRVKLWQGSVGVGYAYNWVPLKGLLVSAMAMPMATFVNRIKVYSYETNVEEIFNSYIFSDDELPSDEELQQMYRVTHAGDQSFNSGININFDARLSVTYNFGRYFVNAYGQFNNFRYVHNNHNGRLNDWYVNAAFGVRL